MIILYFIIKKPHFCLWEKEAGISSGSEPPDKSWPRNCELKPCCVQGKVSGCSQSKYRLQRESSRLLPQWGRKKFPTKFPRHIFIFGIDWPLVPQECKVTSQVGFSTKQGFCLFFLNMHNRSTVSWGRALEFLSPAQLYKTKVPAHPGRIL